MSVAWGTVGEWFGAIVALGVGVAVVFLTAATVRTANAATAATKAMADLQTKSDADATLLRSEERRLLLLSISISLMSAQTQCEHLVGRLRKSMSTGRFKSDFFADGRFIGDFREAFRRLNLEIPDFTKSRLPIVGGATADRIARAMYAGTMLDGYLASIENEGVLTDGHAATIMALLEAVNADYFALTADSKSAIDASGVTKAVIRVVPQPVE
ncbi:hypothetical protein [Luteimonas fraxinea]|uniref:DUF4760 domain-containing protein n=1 Tax=Luteimonas fraxinea TaxID=2901869 RepID=A0ABS8U9G9_9GAMM|nr:hypothetical protein [Luteimonas fraxinea]MCD9096141.1 hypothetical protein [Luteimonas fraxinea]